MSCYGAFAPGRLTGLVSYLVRHALGQGFRESRLEVEDAHPVGTDGDACRPRDHLNDLVCPGSILLVTK
jgi:hypothetical protein